MAMHVVPGTLSTDGEDVYADAGHVSATHDQTSQGGQDGLQGQGREEAVSGLAAAWGSRGQNDECVRVWMQTIRTHPLSWPPGARLLEIGCQDADWLTYAAQADPSIVVTGLDWRGSRKGPGTRLKGDVLVQDFAPGSFEAIAMISTLEHIGLGHYSHDPIAEDGDIETLKRCAEWLVPGGWVYADVPYAAAYSVFKTKCRIYDQQAVLTRLAVPGLRLEYQGWTKKTGEAITQDEAAVPAGFAYTALVWRKVADGV